jgi:hypothetical protein
MIHQKTKSHILKGSYSCSASSLRCSWGNNCRQSDADAELQMRPGLRARRCLWCRRWLLLNYSKKKNSIVCVKGLVDLNSSVSYDEQKLSLLPKVETPTSSLWKPKYFIIKSHKFYRGLYSSIEIRRWKNKKHQGKSTGKVGMYIYSTKMCCAGTYIFQVLFWVFEKRKGSLVTL